MFTSDKACDSTLVTGNAFNTCMQHGSASMMPVLLQRNTIVASLQVCKLNINVVTKHWHKLSSCLCSVSSLLTAIHCKTRLTEVVVQAYTSVDDDAAMHITPQNLSSVE